MKDELEFTKDKYRKDGLSYWCKTCWGKYNKDHRVEKSKYNQEWKRKNPERAAKIDKKYYKGHREERAVKRKKWREENPEYLGEWIKKNSEKWKKLMTKIQAKRKRNLGWEPLYPNPFDECEVINWHHPDDKHVVALPRDLHQLYGGRDVEIHRINLSYIVEQIYGDVYNNAN